MDMINALVKRLVEDDDLIKGVTSRKVKKLMEHLRNAKNENLSPEQRKRAYDNAVSIAQTGKEITPQAKAANLDKLTTAAKGKTSDAANQRLAEIAARLNIKMPKEKEAAATRVGGPKTNPSGEGGFIAPQEGPTRRELETSARRAKIDPKAMPNEYYSAIPTLDDATRQLMEQDKPEQAKRMLTAKYGSQFKEALNNVNKLHSMGDIDSAHELYSAIPKNQLPKTLHDYDPAYMHYGVHPEMWAQMPDPAHRQEMHNIHKQALAGKLDNHPDYANIIPKVKALKAPKTQM